MINGADLSGGVAFDANGLSGLKNAAKENSPEAIKGVAKQFEAIFMNMMLKSMREASPQDNPFDNEQSRTFTSSRTIRLSMCSHAAPLSHLDAISIVRGTTSASSWPRRSPWI